MKQMSGSVSDQRRSQRVHRTVLDYHSIPRTNPRLQPGTGTDRYTAGKLHTHAEMGVIPK